jgi:site-specific DNA recombinase
MPDQPSQKIAVGYVRVSTDDQERGVSLQGQTDAIEKRAAADGAALDRVHQDVMSGGRDDRPDYQAMLADAAAGTFDVLYVWKFDRLGRDAEELLRARRMLEAGGVAIVSVTEGEAESTLIYGVRALVAQEEREKISERTSMGLATIAATEGRQPCGAPPLGYRAVYRDVPGKKKPARFWEVDETEVEIVRRIFSDYLADVGTNTIARRLNEDGVRTRRGAMFSARVVIDTLSNPVYIGLVRFKDQQFRGEHDGIIDAGTWQQTQERREARRATPGNGRGRSPRGPHLFTKGLLRCGACGSAMSARTNTNGWTYYRCTRRHTYGDCSTPAISRERIDEQVLAAFEEILLDSEGTLDGLRAEGQRQVAKARAIAADSERQALAIEESRERVERDYLSGELGAANWERLSEKLENQHAAAVAERERHRAHAETLAAEVAAIDADAELRRRLVELREAVAGRISDAAETVGAVRVALSATFERVVLHHRDGQVYLMPYLRPEAIRPLTPAEEHFWLAPDDYMLENAANEGPPPKSLPIPLKGGEVGPLIPRRMALHFKKAGSEPNVPWPPGTPGRRGRRSRSRGRRAASAPRPRRGAPRGRRARA